MNRLGFLQKTLEDDGMYALRLNEHLLFRAADSDTIKAIGQAIVDIAEAGAFATMIIG
jgi:hypothetical protein